MARVIFYMTQIEYLELIELTHRLEDTRNNISRINETIKIQFTNKLLLTEVEKIDNIIRDILTVGLKYR